jgi:hypothetical protein
LVDQTQLFELLADPSMFGRDPPGEKRATSFADYRSCICHGSLDLVGTEVGRLDDLCEGERVDADEDVVALDYLESLRWSHLPEWMHRLLSDLERDLHVVNLILEGKVDLRAARPAPDFPPLRPVIVRRNYQTGAVLLIDAANVVGSRPTGWWRDRAGAARAFVDQVSLAAEAGRLPLPVVVVLEGKARDGVEAGVTDAVTVLHATGSGDDKLVEVTSDASDASDQVTLVTADRGLRQRAEALGANVVGPGWLLDLL